MTQSLLMAQSSIFFYLKRTRCLRLFSGQLRYIRKSNGVHLARSSRTGAMNFLLLLQSGVR